MGLTKPQDMAGSFDGTIKGFNTSLPAGNNKIGSVDVAGTVEVSKLPAVSINGVPTFKLENPNINVTPTASNSHYSFAEAVSTTEVDLKPAKPLKQLIYLSNDGETDVLIGLDVATTGATKGDNAVIVLKAGEVIDNLERSITSIKLKRTAGNGVVRLLGV